MLKTWRLLILTAILMLAFGSVSTALASDPNVAEYYYDQLTYQGTDTVYSTVWLMKKYDHNHGINNVSSYTGVRNILCNFAKKPWTKVTQDCWVPIQTNPAPYRAHVGYLSGENVIGDKMMYFRLNSTETGSHYITGSWSPDDKNLPA